MDVISYEDTSALSYDPSEERYWDKTALGKELDRTFEICHGCRMCFKYCPSFPSLFEAIDGHADGDIRKLTGADHEKVIGECYQCKLCYVNCPYTDQDKHSYNLDFPSLMQRAVNVKARDEGVPLRSKILGNPDLAGKMNGGLLSGLVNKAMKVNFHRSIMQAILGIHKDKSLPEFHRTSFMKWFGKRQKAAGVPIAHEPAPVGPEDEKVVLFSTCFVNYNNPDVGQDAVAVLEKNNVEVNCPSQNCCGMPGLESGDLKFALKKMKSNVDSLLPYARQGYKILVINPTCSLTLKKEYIRFLPPGEWREKAKVVAGATMDLHEYLFELKKKDRLNRDFKSTPGSVAYHVPCHLRAQNIGFRSRDIMKLIPGSKISPVAECCGHDGTWAMKTEYFDMSLQAGKKSFEGLKEKNADRVATDCPLAAIQLEQGMEAGERPEHPIQILAKAYLSPSEGGHPRATEELEGEES